MAKKKKSSKYSSAKKAAAKSKENKSDMSTAASASSLDDTLDTSDDAARPGAGAEPRAAAAKTPSIFTKTVEGFMTNAFPEITSATLKKYVKNEEQEKIYMEFRDVVRGLSRHGYPLATVTATLFLVSVAYYIGTGPEKDNPLNIEGFLNIPFMMKPHVAHYVADLNGLLQLDPAYTMYNDIQSWMGFVSAAFFTVVIFRIVITCKRSAKNHMREFSCHLYCVYIAVYLLILAAAICLIAVWMHKLMQLYNYLSPRPCVPIQTFISLLYICQPAFEFSTVALIALHRLRIFYHRYYPGVHYAATLGVAIGTWRMYNLLVLSAEAALIITMLYVARCYLLITALFTFLGDIIEMLEM